MGLVCEQSLYNLTERSVELEVIPACEQYGLGLIPWSPLASGILGGAFDTHKDGRRAEKDSQKDIEKYADQLKAYEALCKDIGEKPGTVALAWLLHNPVVTAPIIGPRTMEQLADGGRVVELELDASTLNKLDKIWPGPGGAAPEAYAW